MLVSQDVRYSFVSRVASC